MLNARTLLERIDEQRILIGAKHLDIAEQSDILYVTYINNFKKYKIPKFADLFRIACAIGYPFNDLLSDNPPNPSDNPKNIRYWTEKELGTLKPSSLIYTLADKTAAAAFLDAMKKRAEKKDADEIEQKRFQVATMILSLSDMDLLYYLNSISKYLPYKEHCIEVFKEEHCLYDMMYRIRRIFRSVWSPKNNVTHDLWTTINNEVARQYNNKTQFQRDSGISSRAYNEYLSGKSENSTPGLDTVYKALNLLSITDIDNAVRKNVPEVKVPDTVMRTYTNADLAVVTDKDLRRYIRQNGDTDFTTRYQIFFPEIATTLRFMPDLAIMLDEILSAEPFVIDHSLYILDKALEHPYTDFAYVDPRLREESRI